jgi:hypothetical protein
MADMAFIGCLIEILVHGNMCDKYDFVLLCIPHTGSVLFFLLHNILIMALTLPTLLPVPSTCN